MGQTDEGKLLALEVAATDVLRTADQAIQKASNNEPVKAKALSIIDLDSLKFQQGPRLMANKKCTLPKGSTRIAKAGYEEIYVPAPR